MYDQLRRNLLRRVPFTDQELDRFCEALQVRQVKRKRSVLSQGNIPNFVFYVNKGLVRMYTTEGEEEHTFEFGPEDTWVADLGAFRTKNATRVNIEAVEDSEIFMVHHADVGRLHDEIPRLERFSRFHAEEKYIEVLERLQKINHADYTAEQRYLAFLDAYPHVVHRLPSVHLASYLGIASETLSRLRKQLLKSERSDPSAVDIGQENK